MDRFKEGLDDWQRSRWSGASQGTNAAKIEHVPLREEHLRAAAHKGARSSLMSGVLFYAISAHYVAAHDFGGGFVPKFTIVPSRAMPSSADIVLSRGRGRCGRYSSVATSRDPHSRELGDGGGPEGSAMKPLTLLAILFALCWALVWLMVVIAEEALGWRSVTRGSAVIVYGGLAIWILFGLGAAVFMDPTVGASW